MDLSRKIAGLFILGLPGPRLLPDMEICRDIVDRGLGGVILFNRCLHTPAQPANIVSATQLGDLCASLQELTGDTLLIAVDQEGGRVRRLRPEAGFPEVCSAARMAASGRATERTREEAGKTAMMLAESGINCNFAPVLDLAVNPANPVIAGLERSFSEDPETVAEHAAVWIEEHRSRSLLSCVKHFPGHGSSVGDSHEGFVDISGTWSQLELEPYRLLLSRTGVDLAMIGHLFNRTLDPAFPATLSARIVDGLLRADLGYDGAVISDDLQMRAITAHYPFEEAVCRSLAAGVDMLIFGNNLEPGDGVCRRAVRAVLDGLDRGLIDEARLDQALGRVESLKRKLKKR